MIYFCSASLNWGHSSHLTDGSRRIRGLPEAFEREARKILLRGIPLKQLRALCPAHLSPFQAADRDLSAPLPPLTQPVL